MKQIGAIGALLILGVVWGATIPLTKVAVSTGYQPIGLIFWQLVFAVAVLGAISAFRRVKLVVNRQTLFYFLMISLLGTLLPNSASYIASANLPAGVIAIVIATVPMFSLVIALGLRLEHMSAGRTIGVLSGVIAVVFLIAPETSLPEPEKAAYILLVLAAAICYGIEGAYISLRTPKEIDPVVTLLGASVVGLLVATPLTFVFGAWVDLSKPWAAPEWALLASSILHAFAYAGYIWLVGVTGIVFSSQIAYVVTIAGLFISAIALNETYSGWVWAALVFMVVGLALVQPHKDKAAITSG